MAILGAYEGLIRLKDDSVDLYEGLIAESWEANAGKSVWTERVEARNGSVNAVISRLYDSKKGDLGPVFLLLFGSAAAAALFCAALVWRNRRGRGI